MRRTELFQPERWVFEQKLPESGDPVKKLFPFGGSPRLCQRRFLILTEITMVVSRLMHNFELELDTTARPVKQLKNFFMVQSALQVRLKLRN